jgi:signal peptidase II
MSSPAETTPAKLGPATAYMIAVGVILVDQGSKRYVVEALHLPQIGSMPLVGPVNLTMVWNRSVSMGLIPADASIMRWVLAGFSALVAVLLILWARKQSRGLTLTALGLVIGGAIGNLIDRVLHGAVVDFLDFSQLYFPWVFNVADSAITVGVILLLLDSARGDRLSRPSK